ncbi:MAG: hypothetical protein JRJ02_07640 [Deltaproteobacteria bacterium]|nr:hypothetical protein [Deltaproteobacteria bacterium]
MKAVFTLIPSESRRLIAKAIVQMDEVRTALEKAYVILNGGTTNGYVAQELLGDMQLEPQKFTAGTCTHRLLCVTDADKRTPFPIILYKGKKSDKTLPEALKDFHLETAVIKGANAVDAQGKVGVIAAGFDGGTMGATLGTVVSQGLKYIVPVGLEKMIPSVEEACEWAGAKTLDYTIGADFGIFRLPNAKVVTEIEAFKILADVETKHVASGGVGQSTGAVVLIIRGQEENVRKAISIVESIKGEPVLNGFKGTCETCLYTCKYVGTKLEDLPAWLKE